MGQNIAPNIAPSPGGTANMWFLLHPPEPVSQKHLDWFGGFCMTRGCVQRTDRRCCLLQNQDDNINTQTHTHLFNGPFSGTTQVSRYQKGKTNLDFTEAKDSEWQWHQLGHMQVCTSLQTDNHTS